MTDPSDIVERLRARLADMTKQRDEARADFRKYGGHNNDCPIPEPRFSADRRKRPVCTCGYSAALAKMETQP